MMCDEHLFGNEDKMKCVRCGFEFKEEKLKQTLEQQLAAAKAELVAEREKLAELNKLYQQQSNRFTRLAEQYREYSNRLASHGPEGHQYTNQQFIDMKLAKEEAEAQCAAMRNCQNCKHKRPRKCGFNCADCEKPCPCASCYESKQNWEAAGNG